MLQILVAVDQNRPQNQEVGIGEGIESFEPPAIRGGEEAANGIEMFPSMTRDS